MLWCLAHKAEGSLERLIQNHPETVRQVMPQVPTEYYDDLMARIGKGNPALFKELSVSGKDDFCRRMAQEITGSFARGNTNGTGQQEAVRYLLGEAELDVLYPFVNEWRKGWHYDNGRNQKLFRLKESGRQPQLYRRAVVLEGLCMRAPFFTSYWYGKYHKIDKEEIKGILSVFEQERLPFVYQLEALDGIYSGFYQEKDKTAFANECVMVLAGKKQQWEEEFVKAARGDRLYALCVHPGAGYLLEGLSGCAAFLRHGQRQADPGASGGGL